MVLAVRVCGERGEVVAEYVHDEVWVGRDRFSNAYIKKKIKNSAYF